MMSSMSGYTKLFNSILASTVWREPMETRIVWITLLAMADRNGVAEASVPGLSDFARVSIKATREALVRLQSPDPDSRSQEYEGRRIEQVEGGWRLLNHAKYRAKMGADERREYNRIKQAQYRERQKMSLTVNHNKQSVDITEADTEADTKRTLKSLAQRKALSDSEIVYQSYPRKVGKKEALRAIQVALHRLQNGEAPAETNSDEALAWLISRTKLFALSPAGQNGQYTPHPATWYNAARYLDDESEWLKNGQVEPSKTKQRTDINRAALAEGFGLTPPPGHSGGGSGQRVLASRGKLLEGTVKS